MILAKEQLCRLIPHAGAMCLLDRVEFWDETTILCTSRTHTDLDNPLCSQGRLHVICGVEYAAQAIAVHGGLLSSRPSPPGYLASMRDVHLSAQRIDDIDQQLEIQAMRVAANARSLVYRFTVSVGKTELLGGRATVFLERASE